MPGTFSAFIDEAGQRSTTQKSSDHFIMSAVIIGSADLATVASSQSQLRRDLRRGPTDSLHWRNLKGHALRLHSVQVVSQMPLTIASVVVCKRHLQSTPVPDEDYAYLFTLRFLLERLSWFARDREGVVQYTLAHVVRFKLSQLREYEAKLRSDPSCQVSWANLDIRGGRLDQPSRIEQLQLADLAASSTFQAFEPDQYGNTERRYLTELARVLYRRPPGALTSYGLKMHPWNAVTRGVYPWVATL